jgi:hypothetical protein
MAASIRTLRQRTVPLREITDPLGIEAQTRGVATQLGDRQAMVDRSYTDADPLLAMSAATGPLPDPRWAGFFQSLADAGVTKLRGGPSAPGSTQLTGQDIMPPDRGTAGDALAGVAASMPLQLHTPGGIVGVRGGDATAAPPAPTPPPAPPAPPTPPPGLSLDEARRRVQQGMRRGSLGALRNRLDVEAGG